MPVANGAAALALMWSQLGARERKVLILIGERLLMGQKAYGHLTQRKKDWAKEAAEEAFDGTVYLAALLTDLADEEDRKD